MLLRVLELFRDNDELRGHYRPLPAHSGGRVPGHQRHSVRQLRLLTNDDNAATIVGDDDQSIYGWRGAKIENIHKFSRDFPDTRTVRLEQNYRSTGTILNAANAVISVNSDRLGKELWTDGGDGEPIRLYAGFNEVDEARFIAGKVESLGQQGMARREMAVLYRSNAQSRVLEEAFLQAGTVPPTAASASSSAPRSRTPGLPAPVNNRRADAAFERVVNTPTRGIGAKTLEILRDLARQRGVPLWDAAAALINEQLLTARAGNALLAFLKLVDKLARKPKG